MLDGEDVGVDVVGDNDGEDVGDFDGGFVGTPLGILDGEDVGV
jgi:hypothetical protein